MKSYIVLGVFDTEGVQRKDVSIDYMCYKSEIKFIDFESMCSDFKLGCLMVLDIKSGECLQYRTNEEVVNFIESLKGLPTNIMIKRNNGFVRCQILDLGWKNYMFCTDVEIQSKDSINVIIAKDKYWFNSGGYGYTLFSASFSLENLESMRKFLVEIPCEYIDIYKLSQKLPFKRGVSAIKMKLLGKYYFAGIKKISNNKAVFYIEKFVDLSYYEQVMSRDGELRIAQRKKEKNCGYDSVEVYDIYDIVCDCKNIGTLYDLLLSIKDYLEQYPMS